MIRNFGKDGKPIYIKGYLIKKEDFESLYKIVSKIRVRNESLRTSKTSA